MQQLLVGGTIQWTSSERSRVGQQISWIGWYEQQVQCIDNILENKSKVQHQKEVQLADMTSMYNALMAELESYRKEVSGQLEMNSDLQAQSVTEFVARYDKQV